MHVSVDTGRGGGALRNMVVSGSEAGPLLVVVAYSHSALSVGLRTTPSYSV